MTLIDRIVRNGSVVIDWISAEAMGEYVLLIAEERPDFEVEWRTIDGEMGDLIIRKTYPEIAEKRLRRFRS